MSAPLLVTLILLTLNLVLLYRSNRKRKYGIYPGWISIVIFVLFAGYYESGLIINSNFERPSVKNYRKNVEGSIKYRKSMSDYEYKNLQIEQKISEHRNYLTYFYIAAKIQCIIAICFSIFGLLFVTGRNKFYWIITSIYAVVISVFYLLID